MGFMDVLAVETCECCKSCKMPLRPKLFSTSEFTRPKATKVVEPPRRSDKCYKKEYYHANAKLAFFLQSP